MAAGGASERKLRSFPEGPWQSASHAHGTKHALYSYMAKSNIAVGVSAGTIARESEAARPETGAGDSAVAMLVLSVVLLMGVALMILSNLFRTRVRPSTVDEPAFAH